MFQEPDCTRNVSMRLSEVLAEIGVNEKIVLKRRRTWLLDESLSNTSLQLQDQNCLTYKLGSQSEGTTTLGLNSDMDNLLCMNDFNVIKDCSDWELGVHNLLMIQDETVSPGYCLLQRLRDDSPFPFNGVFNQCHFKDRAGRILMKNTALSAIAAEVYMEEVRHGPAYAYQGRPGIRDTDTVPAFPCKAPLQALQRLGWLGVGQWPSNNMRRYCNNSRCFVVGVGSKDSENEELEWRISTSLAERCLMFNLNITQIRCYILMKMILKTYFKPQFGDTVSSFMCKTVLFHCIANTHSDIWKECNLLACLSLYLFILYNSILNENCPHFFTPENNLMRGHIPHEFKPYILEILQYIINNKRTALLGIKCDALGVRLQRRMFSFQKHKTVLSDIVSGHLLMACAESTDIRVQDCINIYKNSSYQVVIRTLLKYIFKLFIIYNQYHGLNKTSSCLLASPFCTALGSVLASLSIQQYNAISAEALAWISLGLNTDVASSKLKLASMFYCIGDAQRTENILRDVEGSYDLNCVAAICGCYCFPKLFRRGFSAIAGNHKEEAIQHIAAFCVRYLQCEINCVPHELQYEFFRSTEEDLVFRSDLDDWMDLAVVDSLSYLYFLQYKTYGYLGRQDDKKTALSNLVKTIDQEPNLRHRETALNLLGQCMEEEDRAVDALRCYSISLDKRGENNAAKIHLCRLLSKIANN